MPFPVTDNIAVSESITLAVTPLLINVSDTVTHTEQVTSALTTGTPLSYNYFNLQTPSVTTTEFDDGNSPERQTDFYKLLDRGGGVVGNDQWYTKTIHAKGYLKGTSVTNLESLLDTFMAALTVKSKPLDISYAGSNRRYTATPSAIKIDRQGRAIATCLFELDFIATGYGRDSTLTTLVPSTASSAASTTDSLTVGGSAPEQMLRVQVTVTALTGTGPNTISIQNVTTGEVLSVNRVWTAGDILFVDYFELSVKVNNVETDFSGAFPNFAPGSHQLTITNDFTTCTLTRNVDHFRRYL